MSATHLKPTQQPEKARHRPAVQAEVENLLDRGRVEHRHQRRGELVIRLVRQRGRLRAVIVAGQHEHAAVFRRAGMVRVLEHIAATVHTGPLAVPHREHAVVFRAGIEVDLLRSPQRGRGEVLVQSGLELDVRAFEELSRFPQRLVERAQRRAAIARDETCGIEALDRVALALQDQQADERLGAGEIDAARFERVFIVEGNFTQGGDGGGHEQCSTKSCLGNAR